MHVFSIIAVSITAIKLFMLAGVWPLSDVLGAGGWLESEYQPTHVHHND